MKPLTARERFALEEAQRKGDIPPCFTPKDPASARAALEKAGYGCQLSFRDHITVWSLAAVSPIILALEDS